jgi:DNA topoisomerase VI subunit B
LAAPLAGMVKQKEDLLQQKSPAEFFADNRTIAGFDNVRLRSGKEGAVCIER